MNVSSYLEAFLTVYGWEMYYILYLLLGATGLFMYPLLRLYATTIIEYFSGSEYAGTNFLRSALTNTLLAILVFIVALVPFVPIDLSSTKVSSVCVDDKKPSEISDDKSDDSYFSNISAYVPIMPWIAMRIGHGINAVIYTEAPCALDITKTKKAILNPDLSNSEDGGLLKAEYERYNEECHQQVRGLIGRIQEGEFGEEAQSWFVKELRKLEDRERTFWQKVYSSNKNIKMRQELLINFVDSSLIQDYFYNSNGPLKSVKGLETIADSINAANSVQGYNGYTKGSAMQGVAGVPPSCSEWWNGAGGKQGLRVRLASALSDSVIQQVADPLGVKECKPDVGLSGTGHDDSLSANKLAQCKGKVIEDIFEGDEENYTKQLLLSQQGRGMTDSLLSTGDNLALSAMVAAGIGSTVLSLWKGIDLAGNVTGQIAGFYATLYLLKLLLRYFIPMILMAIYMFWGVYMIIGEFRGTTMIKGMILIIALTMMPGLWAIIDHLDDKLWEAMYGTSGMGDLFNMLLLDVATSIFQVSVVMVLFFLINAAGGGDAGGAVGDSQKMGRETSQGVGGSAGQGMGKFGRWATTGKRDKQGNIVSGGWGVRAAGYLKGASGKSKGK